MDTDYPKTSLRSKVTYSLEGKTKTAYVYGLDPLRLIPSGADVQSVEDAGHYDRDANIVHMSEPTVTQEGESWADRKKSLEIEKKRAA